MSCVYDVRIYRFLPELLPRLVIRADPLISLLGYLRGYGEGCLLLGVARALETRGWTFQKVSQIFIP